MTKIYGLLQLIIISVFLHNCLISIDSYSPVNNNFYNFLQLHNFYPTALKGCQGIVFTHAVWMGRRMGRRVGGRREEVCPGCISETVRCRKLILGRDIGQDV